jgi:hypothetical protein
LEKMNIRLRQEVEHYQSFVAQMVMEQQEEKLRAIDLAASAAPATKHTDEEYTALESRIQRLEAAVHAALDAPPTATAAAAPTQTAAPTGTTLNVHHGYKDRAVSPRWGDEEHARVEAMAASLEHAVAAVVEATEEVESSGVELTPAQAARAKVLAKLIKPGSGWNTRGNDQHAWEVHDMWQGKTGYK